MMAIVQGLIFPVNRLKFINQQYSSIGSNNGLAPTRRQAIIWTNDGKFTVTYRYMRHSASMS